MSAEYDFLVIGGGSAGYAAARTAVDLGMKTAVIDGAETLGGLCILRGCMPSKTLIESANRFREMRNAGTFGLHAEGISFHLPEVIARKRALIDDFASYRQEQLKDGRFDLIRGTAKFSSAHSVKVTPRDGSAETEVHFRSAVVATGSRVARIPIPGLEETGYWTSSDILDSEDLPESVIILGGGAIALEAASHLEGFGIEVTLIQRSEHLLSDADADVGKAIGEALASRETLTLYTDTEIEAVTKTETGKKRVEFLHKGEKTVVEAAEILQALGREALTDGLDCDAAGVERDEKSGKISCDADQRSSAGHIFAAGDVCGPLEIVHLAVEQGEIAAHNAGVLLDFTKEPLQKMDYRLKLLGIFSDPGVASVGMTEKEAAEEGRSVAASTYPFDDHGKSMIKNELHGFVKLIADTTSGEIVGAAVVGPHAVELIHEVVVAMHFRATTREFMKIPHYHPTLSEIWTYPAEELLF